MRTRATYLPPPPFDYEFWGIALAVALFVLFVLTR